MVGDKKKFAQCLGLAGGDGGDGRCLLNVQRSRG